MNSFELVNLKQNSVVIYMISGVLNGQLMLTQNGTERTSKYISSATPLNQTIRINDDDLARIANATYVNVYWFVDCEYVGQTEDWNVTNFFKAENETHNIEALLMVGFCNFNV